MKRGQTRNFTLEEKQQVAQLGREGVPTRVIAERFNVTGVPIRRVLREMGVFRDGRGYDRKHSLDKAFFSVLLNDPAAATDAHAWLLGIHATDGTCDEQSGRIRFKLSVEDMDVLEKIKVLVKSNAPIHIRQEKESVNATGRTITPGKVGVLSLNSKAMVSDVAALGFGGTKTHRLSPWNGPAHLMAAWWRGVLDGDGSYGCKAETRQRGGNRVLVQLTGNQFMCEAFAAFAVDVCGVTTARVKKRKLGMSWDTQIGGLTNCQKVVSVLYDGATVWMDRKKVVADKMLATRKTRYRSEYMTKDQLVEAYDRLGSWKAVGKHIGIRCIVKFKQRLGIPNGRRRPDSPCLFS